jgi:FkbM family methyltransferase
MGRVKWWKVQQRLTRPIRQRPLRVVRGPGRGLRVCVGESNLSRVFGGGEPLVEKAFLELLQPGDVVFDIGANIGWFSILAARRVGAGQVLAFEPEVENAALTQRNADRNRLANVTVVAAAVTDRDGWARFLSKSSLKGRLDKDDDATQAARRAAHEQRVKRTVPVPVLSLDRWLEQTQEAAPQLIKIDVEGAEIGALRGMQETLRSAKPTLIIELHGTRDAVLDLLDSFDYEHSAIEVDTPTREAPNWVHVLARPRSLGSESPSFAAS